jgi:hypothetical protein
VFHVPRTSRVLSRTAAIIAALVAVIVLLVVLSAIRLLPQLRNPFAETTTVRSQPALLKSITSLSRYEAASGTFQVVVSLSRSSFLPAFLEGSQTLFVGDGTVIAYVDFAGLKGNAIKVSPDHLTVTVLLPHAQLEPAVLNVSQSYVYAQQQGFLTRVANFFSGNPNSQQAVYIAAQRDVQNAARRSALVADAQRNTTLMLNGMLSSLGFKHITVAFTH